MINTILPTIHLNLVTLYCQINYIYIVYLEHKRQKHYIYWKITFCEKIITQHRYVLSASPCFPSDHVLYENFRGKLYLHMGLDKIQGFFFLTRYSCYKWVMCICFPCMHEHTAFACHAHRSDRYYLIPWNCILGQLWMARWMLGTKPGPLPEQPGLFTSELSVQPQKPRF